MSDEHTAADLGQAMRVVETLTDDERTNLIRASIQAALDYTRSGDPSPMAQHARNLLGTLRLRACPEYVEAIRRRPEPRGEARGIDEVLAELDAPTIGLDQPYLGWLDHYAAGWQPVLVRVKDGERTAYRLGEPLPYERAVEMCQVLSETFSAPIAGELSKSQREFAQPLSTDGDVTNLPAWDDMSDLDKGAALLHLVKAHEEGSAYAREHYAARYFDNPALKALDKAAACDHAASLFKGGMDEVVDKLGEDEIDRLYDLALDADRSSG